MELVAYSLTVSYLLVLDTDNLYLEHPIVSIPFNFPEVYFLTQPF